MRISALVYCAAAAIMGRHVIAALGTHVVNDPGDPALNAAILAWNARNIPWTDAWFQFPIFYPAADALTFSEHLLGVSLIATPAYWLTGSEIAAYNVALLVTYPLCGLAMYALVHRLTGSAAAAFLAGLAYAFAPYRAAQVAHIQMLTVFWAPLSLLGLHAYLETRRRRWLALFAAAWVIQGAANSYLLVYFSVLVGLWVLWFALSQRRWTSVAAIGVAAVVAVLPLAPILLRFVRAHAHNGFTRAAGEVAYYSAEVTSLACPHPLLTTWGWMQTGCRLAASGEQYLFPGVSLVVLLMLGAWLSRREPPDPPTALGRGLTILSRVCAGAAALFLGSALSVVINGPWLAEVGPVRVSSSSVIKPFTMAVALLIVSALTSPPVRALPRRASVGAFYFLAGVVMLALSWGPAPLMYGQPALDRGPFAWLALLPGIHGLRVPARFFIMTVLCLCVLMGVQLAPALKRWRPARVALLVVFASAGLFADGWSTLRVGEIPPGAPDPARIRGGVALTLPLGSADTDGPAELEAIAGGWASVNGWSGYRPVSYHWLREGQRPADPAVLRPLMGRGDLHIIVRPRASSLLPFVHALPGAELVAEANGVKQFRVPRLGTPPPTAPSGTRLRIASVNVSCSTEYVALPLDGDYTTRWHCGSQRPGQAITIDLGSVVTAGSVVPALGPFSTDAPRQLVVETSKDGLAWEPARDGTVLPEVIEAEFFAPTLGRIVLEFPPRPARYVRLRQLGRDEIWFWSIAELEVWSGASGN